MVNNVNAATSQLLEQIKRLSSSTAKKDVQYLDFKDSLTNDRANNIQNLHKGANLMNIENIQKRDGINTQLIDDIKKEGKNVNSLERSQPQDVEKRRYKEPLGSFLDIYL